MSTCILITSHLNHPTKKLVAKKTLEKLQNKGLPIILVGNFPIEVELQSLANFTLNVKENPKTITHRLQICRGEVYEEWGYAHVHQMIHGFKLCDILGYDYVHHFNYDIDIEEEKFKKVQETSLNKNFIHYQFGDNPNEMSSACFSIKTKDFLEVIPPLFHFYYNENPPGIIEGWCCESWMKWAFRYDGRFGEMNNPHPFKFGSKVGNHDIMFPSKS